MPSNRWIDQTQPQTLFIAVILLYVNAGFGIVFSAFDPFVTAIAVGQVAAGYGIANEKKWGYGLGLVMAFVPFVLLFLRSFGGVDIVTLMFEIALVALLLHPQSREYQRIWFK